MVLALVSLEQEESIVPYCINFQLVVIELVVHYNSEFLYDECFLWLYHNL